MSKDKDEKPSISVFLDKLLRRIDENKRLVTYALYGVSVVGGLLVLRSLRAFKQFKNVKDIPEELIVNNYSIFGKVEGSEIVINKDKIAPCLFLTHIPIFGKSRRDQNHEIPVIIYGVRLHPDYFVQSKQILTSKTENRKVKVTILSSSREELKGKVCLKKFGLWNDCLGEKLIKQGFAQVLLDDFAQVDGKDLLNYRGKLEKQEVVAKRNKVGLWQVGKTESSLLSKFSFMDKIYNFFKSRLG